MPSSFKINSEKNNAYIIELTDSSYHPDIQVVYDAINNISEQKDYDLIGLRDFYTDKEDKWCFEIVREPSNQQIYKLCLLLTSVTPNLIDGLSSDTELSDITPSNIVQEAYGSRPDGCFVDSIHELQEIVGIDNESQDRSAFGI